MDKRLLIPVLIGVAVVTVVVVFIFVGNKGAHLELQWKLVKPRVGSIDENSSAVITDFRIFNDSDIRFEVSNVTATLTEPNGGTADAEVIAASDVPQLLQFNRFLGDQYNPVLKMGNEIRPHEMFDRMVAVRLEVPLAVAQKSKLTLTLRDVDGVESSTTVPLQ